MITGFVGRRGRGKTLLMTRRLYQRYLAGYRVMTNYHVNFPHEKLDADRLLKMGDDLQDCAIGIDELHVLMDSRNSQSGRNKLLSYFILQTRKRNVVLFYTTQHEMQVDVRLRRNTDFWVKCERVGKNVFEYEVLDGMTLGTVAEFQMLGTKWYGLYDTRQAITDFAAPSNDAS